MANLKPNKLVPGEPFSFLESKCIRVAEATTAYVRFKVTHLPHDEIDSLITWLTNIKEFHAQNR